MGSLTTFSLLCYYKAMMTTMMCLAIEPILFVVASFPFFFLILLLLFCIVCFLAINLMKNGEGTYYCTYIISLMLWFSSKKNVSTIVIEIFKNI